MNGKIIEGFHIRDRQYVIAEENGRFGLYSVIEKNVESEDYSVDFFPICRQGTLAEIKESALDFIQEQTHGSYYDNMSDYPFTFHM